MRMEIKANMMLFCEKCKKYSSVIGMLVPFAAEDKDDEDFLSLHCLEKDCGEFLKKMKKPESCGDCGEEYGYNVQDSICPHLPLNKWRDTPENTP